MELVMYHIKEVKTKKLEEEFLKIPALLYEVNEETKWVSPLFSDTKSFFDVRKNPLLKDGEANRWLLYDVNKHPIGRIAAFYWNKTIGKQDPRMGYFGFFECAEDKRGAERLFKIAMEWLLSKGMKGMQGPFHLGGPGFFIGSLIRGFFEPVYGVPYNFSFYNDLFLNYGFNDVSKFETYRISLSDSLNWKFVGKKTNRFYHDLRYHIEFYNHKNGKKYAEDFAVVFNKVWAGFPGMAAMTPQRVMDRFRLLRPVLVKKTIFFIYFENIPVAFFVAVPDIHEVIRKFKGKYNIFDKVRLWLAVNVFKKVNTLSGLIYGVAPEHRGKELEAVLFYTLKEQIKQNKLKYRELKLSRVGDFAPDTKKIIEQLDGRLYHLYVTYQLMFDEVEKRNRKTDVAS